AFALGANDQLADASAYKNLVIAWRVSGQTNATPSATTGSSTTSTTVVATGATTSPPRGAPVRLSDIGSGVADGGNNRGDATYDGRPAVVLDIQRQPGDNIVQTVEAVKQQLPLLRRAMPSGIRLTIVSDRTETIRASVADVQFTLILSV